MIYRCKFHALVPLIWILEALLKRKLSERAYAFNGYCPFSLAILLSETYTVKLFTAIRDVLLKLNCIFLERLGHKSIWTWNNAPISLPVLSELGLHIWNEFLIRLNIIVSERKRKQYWFQFQMCDITATFCFVLLIKFCGTHTLYSAEVFTIMILTKSFIWTIIIQILRNCFFFYKNLLLVKHWHCMIPQVHH